MRCRCFKIQIEKAVIDELIYAATLAPSVKNRQPWKFIVYQGSAKDDLIAFIGTEHQLTGIVAVGVADENPDKRPRKKIEDIVEFR